MHTHTFTAVPASFILSPSNIKYYNIYIMSLMHTWSIYTYNMVITVPEY